MNLFTRSARYALFVSFFLLLVIPTSQPAHAAALALHEGDESLTASAEASASYDWLQFGFDEQHSGNNTLETEISRANVSQLRKLFQVRLPSRANNAPVYLHSVQTANGTKDLLFLTTRAGHIVALDALTGAQVWVHKYGAGSCLINNDLSRKEPCYTTSSPAVDPNLQFVYSYGLDGNVHKYGVQDGTEALGGGWPELVTRKRYDEKGSSDLSFATDPTGTTFLYVTTSSFGDRGNYEGHLTSIDLGTGAQRVFNALCSDKTVHFVDSRVQVGPDCLGIRPGMAGIWARPGVVYSQATNRVYIATGNGKFTPASHYWGDSVFALLPSGVGSNGNPLDSFTPENFQYLASADLDIGSTAPAILPVPAKSSVTHLAVQSGKDGQLRLLNLDNLSGRGGPGHTGGEVGKIVPVPQGGEVLTQPAVWVNPSDGSTWVFVANDFGLSGLKLKLDASHTPQLEPMWRKSKGGSSPIIANGVLYYAGYHLVQALDPVSGRSLWQDTQIAGIHWESPILANGMLYISDQSGKMTAYSLNGS